MRPTRLFVIALIIIPGSFLVQQKDRNAEAHNLMAQSHIISRGISNPLTLEAMRKVPRYLFVPLKRFDK